MRYALVTLFAVLLLPGCQDAEQQRSAVAAETIESTVWVGGEEGGNGAGVIVGQRHILVCAHVVEEAKKMKVYFYDDYFVSATVIASDPATDLALLYVQIDFDVRAIRLARSPAVVGQTVIAVGHPYGLDYSVSAGVVSGHNRTISFADGRSLTLMQHAAGINPGNSGGPLVNLHGDLVGLNNAIYRGANSLGFAVPLETIRTFLQSQTL